MIFRRGSILIAVMMIVVIAALTGATTMYMAGAEVDAAAVSLRRVQSRALAWSGVQAAMAELADQRERLIDGEVPELTREWELYASEAGSRGIVRLLEIEPGRVAASEQARLDLNTATQEMLVAAGLDAKIAAAIVEGRKSAPLASVEELLRIPGITAATLKGETESATESDADKAAPGAPLDLLTVFSFDPNIQAGLGENGSEHRGRLRVNLHTPWSEELATAIDERFGEGSSKIVKSFVDQGAEFKSMSEIVQTLRTVKLEPKDWGPVLDAFTVSRDLYLRGKVDLNLASPAVLACIPGFDAEIAAQIVQVREKIDATTRPALSWPLEQGVVTPEQFELAVDWLTTRTMQWRVRVEAGVLPPSRDDRFLTEAPPLQDRIVLEAVIDVASERPRVAYLRDITLMDTAEAIYQSVIAAGEAGIESEPSLVGIDDLLPPEVDPSAPARPGIDLHEIDLGAGKKVGAGLTLSNDLSLTTMAPGLSDLDFGGFDLGMDEEEPELVGPPVPREVREEVARAAPDSRLGRWNVPRKEGATP